LDYKNTKNNNENKKIRKKITRFQTILVISQANIEKQIF